MPAATILVVDDEQNILTSVSRALSFEGYEVEVAADGAAGLEQASGGEFDLIISDMKMPKMNGIELLREIRDRQPDALVIMMTAFSSTEDAVKAMKQGAYDYANKYTPGATEYLCPAPFDLPLTHAIQEVGLSAFRAIGGRDYARVDVMVSQDQTPVVLEVNTLPGMTETSLLPKIASLEGLSFDALVEEILKDAMEKREVM